jgi:hypothetical protein
MTKSPIINIYQCAIVGFKGIPRFHFDNPVASDEETLVNKGEMRYFKKGTKRQRMMEENAVWIKRYGF